MTRQRLLFLCQTLPWPPDGGVKIRSYHTLRLLSEHFDVESLCFTRRATASDVPAGIEALGRLGPVQVFPIPQEHSRLRWVLDHGRSLFTGKAYTEYVHEHGPFLSALREALVRFRPDHVHVDSLDLSRALRELPAERVVLTHHNVESQLLLRRADRAGPAVGAYLRHQARLTARMERHWAPRVRGNITVSEEDARALRTVTGAEQVAVIPNGVDTRYFAPAARAEDGVVFVGGTTWFPNRDGLEWFAQDVMPLLRQARPGLRATWVGRSTEVERQQYERLGITLTGYVEDIRPWVHAAAVYICPLRVGGGTRLKLLDAWALGMPIVSTPQGAEGLSVEDGVNMLLAREPQAFASAVLRLLDSRHLADSIAEAGRATVERLYGWDRIGDQLAEVYLGTPARMARE